MDRVAEQVGRFLSGHGLADDVQRLETVNCHHNYTERERHDCALPPPITPR